MPRNNILSLLVALGLLGACQLRMGSQPGVDAPAQTFLSPGRIETLTPFQPIPPTSTFTPIPTPTGTPTPLPRITLLFTGVIVPARCVQAGVDARGSPDYIYAEVRHLIRQADLAGGTVNASSNGY